MHGAVSATVTQCRSPVTESSVTMLVLGASLLVLGFLLRNRHFG